MPYVLRLNITRKSSIIKSIHNYNQQQKTLEKLTSETMYIVFEGDNQTKRFVNVIYFWTSVKSKMLSSTV